MTAIGWLALGGDLQAAAGQPELPLGGLVGVGDARHGDRLGPPASSRARNVPESSGASSLTMIFVSKSSPALKPEVLVGRPGVAIAAAVRAAPVRVDAVAEAHVGAVVLGDDGLRAVGRGTRWAGRQAVEVVLVVLERARGRARGTGRRSGSAGRSASPRPFASGALSSFGHSTQPRPRPQSR